MPGLAEAHLRHSRCYFDALHNANRVYIQGGRAVLQGMRLFDLEWENIRVGQQWAANNSIYNLEAAELCSRYPGGMSSVV